jgi:hypothetical protein
MPRLETVWLAMERASRRAALKVGEAARAQLRESMNGRWMVERCSFILWRRSAAASAIGCCGGGAVVGIGEEEEPGVQNSFRGGGTRKQKTRHLSLSLLVVQGQGERNQRSKDVNGSWVGLSCTAWAKISRSAQSYVFFCLI